MKVAFLCFGEDGAFDYTKSFEYIKEYLTAQQHMFDNLDGTYDTCAILKEILNTRGFVGHKDNIPVFHIFTYYPNPGRKFSDTVIESMTLKYYQDRSYLIDNAVKSGIFPYRIIVQDIDLFGEIALLISEWNNGNNSN